MLFRSGWHRFTTLKGQGSFGRSGQPITLLTSDGSAAYRGRLTRIGTGSSAKVLDVVGSQVTGNTAALGGGVFFAVYLLRAGVPAPAVFGSLALIVALRFLVRPTVLVLGKRWGLKPLLIAGTILTGLSYPLLAEVHGIGPALVALCVVSAVGDTFYWTSYHAYFASVGDAEHLGLVGLVHADEHAQHRQGVFTLGDAIIVIDQKRLESRRWNQHALGVIVKHLHAGFLVNAILIAVLLAYFFLVLFFLFLVSGGSQGKQNRRALSQTRGIRVDRKSTRLNSSHRT